MSQSERGRASTEQGSYCAVDKLEIMESAHRYNAFLESLIRSRLPLRGTVVDLGAGTGTFARRLSTTDLDLLCVEPDPLLRERLAATGMKTVADLAELRESSVDFLYTLNVLEHIEDDAAILRLVASRLRPGGRLLIYVPAFPLLYSRMDRLVGHHRRYLRRGLCRLLEAAGLTIDRALYVDSLGFLAALVFKAFTGDGNFSARSVAAYDRLVFPVSRVIDVAASSLLGKNLLVEAHRPVDREARSSSAG